MAQTREYLDPDDHDLDALDGPERPPIVILPPPDSAGSPSARSLVPSARSAAPARVKPSRTYQETADQIRAMKLARPAKTELLKVAARLGAQTIIEEQASEEAKQTTRTIAAEAIDKLETLNTLQRAVGDDPSINPDYFAVLRGNVVTGAGNRITESEERRARTLRELDALPEFAEQWINPTLVERVDDALASAVDGLTFGKAGLEGTEQELSPLETVRNYLTFGQIAYKRRRELMAQEREAYAARHRAAQAGFAGEIIDVDPK